MRKTYALTDQTIKALIGHEADIAVQMECDPSYIYGIKTAKSPDPYPKFREMYRATVNAGGGYEHWDDDLATIRSKKENQSRAAIPNIRKLLLEKIKNDSASTERMVEAISDGVLTQREIHDILIDIRRIRANVREIEEALYIQMAADQSK